MIISQKYRRTTG